MITEGTARGVEREFEGALLQFQGDARRVDYLKAALTVYLEIGEMMVEIGFPDEEEGIGNLDRWAEIDDALCDIGVPVLALLEHEWQKYAGLEDEEDDEQLWHVCDELYNAYSISEHDLYQSGVLDNREQYAKKGRKIVADWTDRRERARAMVDGYMAQFKVGALPGQLGLPGVGSD